MPILPREPDIYPEDLLDSAEPLADEWPATWWAIYTLPRREKDLMRRLRKLEIPFYSPLVERRTRSPAGRMRTSHVPLFPSYLFLFGDQEQRREALTTNCISRCLEVPDGTGLVGDLRRIRQLIESGEPLTPEAQLESGTPVVVRSGLLAGLEGVVIKRHGQTRLLVAVEFLQQGASILLEDVQVERIG